MAVITFKGNKVNTSGNLPAVGAKAPDFMLTTGALGEVSLAGLLSRAVVVLDKSDKVIYVEQVPEIAQEPNYEAALAAAKKAL